jgi:hypothetical protein
MMPEQRNLGDLFEDEVQRVQGPQRQLVSVVDLSQPDPRWGASKLVPLIPQLSLRMKFLALWRRLW